MKSTPAPPQACFFSLGDPHHPVVDRSQVILTPQPVKVAAAERHDMRHGHELLRAAFLGDLTSVRLLTGQGGGRGQQTQQQLPIEHHYGRGNLPMCCPPGHKGPCKSTALVEACNMGHLCIAQYLIGSGVDVNQRNEAGVSPLWAAAGRECPRLVEILLEGGADARMADSQGNTPLMRAAWGAKVEVVECLLQSDPEAVGIDMVNKDGCTALWFATFYGRAGIVRKLLEAGADWKVGKDPCAVAVAQGRHSIRALFEEAERRYVLHKTRLICDTNNILSCSHQEEETATAAIPAFLAARQQSEEGKLMMMPSLEAPPSEPQEGGSVLRQHKRKHPSSSSSASRKGGRGRKRRRDEEQERQVFYHVVSDLKPELFVELDQMMLGLNNHQK